MASVWQTRLDNLHRYEAAQEAYYAAVMAPANDCHDKAVAELVANYGSVELARSSPIGRAKADSDFAELRRSEDGWDRAVDATSNAAEVLMLTPAPDLSALIVKARVIEKHELCEAKTRISPIAALRQDLEDLTA